MYGQSLGYTTPPPKEEPSANPAKKTALQRFLMEEGGDERSGERTGGKARASGIDSEVGWSSIEAPAGTESWSDYETARRSDNIMKNVGTGATLTGLLGPTGISTLVGIGNKLHGTAVARPEANVAFGKARGIGGEIPGLAPISAAKDLSQWDLLFGSPFEQLYHQAIEQNQNWARNAPEVFGYQGVDQGGGGPGPGGATGPAPGGGWNQDNPEAEEYYGGPDWNDPGEEPGGWGWL
tara:strand:- start:16943 stop:17653 length:711 start_codon:yes stop_codon:yes gene_type:complete